MPEPIIEPTTTIVESNRPRPRVNSVSSIDAESGFGGGPDEDFLAPAGADKLAINGSLV
jgi:hypothetical protein